ncbi:MAG: hypothetical protein LH679_05070 [Cyanobacteria bacterium CAN_BIN43]|nr:hypothetical protein [Cyanobacteria bacterium CAN_BIN43]
MRCPVPSAFATLHCAALVPVAITPSTYSASFHSTTADSTRRDSRAVPAPLRLWAPTGLRKGDRFFMLDGTTLVKWRSQVVRAFDMGGCTLVLKRAVRENF